MEELRNTISEKDQEIKEHKENIEELEKVSVYLTLINDFSHKFSLFFINKRHIIGLFDFGQRIDEEKVEKASLDQNTSTLKKNLSL